MRGGHSPFKPRPRRSWRAPGELLNFTLYFLCAVLLVLSRIGHGAVADVRDRLVDLSAPLLEAASAPVIMGRHGLARVRSYVGMLSEIDRLKARERRAQAMGMAGQAARAQRRPSPLAAQRRR